MRDPLQARRLICLRSVAPSAPASDHSTDTSPCATEWPQRWRSARGGEVLKRESHRGVWIEGERGKPLIGQLVLRRQQNSTFAVIWKEQAAPERDRNIQSGMRKLVAERINEA